MGQHSSLPSDKARDAIVGLYAPVFYYGGQCSPEVVAALRDVSTGLEWGTNPIALSIQCNLKQRSGLYQAIVERLLPFYGSDSTFDADKPALLTDVDAYVAAWQTGHDGAFPAGERVCGGRRLKLDMTAKQIVDHLSAITILCFKF